LNKDNLLFVTIGILVGFIAGYLLHEVMAARQPARLVAGQVPAGAAPAPPNSANPADPAALPPGAGGEAGTAPMAEVQRLREYVEANPNDADAVRQLANMNFDIRNWQRASELYDQYLGLRPNDPDVMTDLGVSYRELGRFDEALALFDQVQGSKPDHWQSYFNEVVVLAFDLKRFDAAAEVLAQLQRIQPANPEVERLAAEVQRQKNAA
jgi:tetratricopeptide (TPR) repeat protein